MATQEQIKVAVTRLLLPFLEKASASTLECHINPGPATLRVWLWVFTLVPHSPLTGGPQDTILYLTFT